MNENYKTSEHFSNFNALYDASYKVCKNVRWKDSVISFEESRLNIIFDTQEKLRDKTYRQLPFSCFSTIERGKQRDIRACHINDRLVQNSLCESELLPQLVPKFIYDNYATLKNRGIDFALKRAKVLLQKAHREYGRDKTFYVCRLDMSKYFDTINHEDLILKLDKFIDNQEVKDLTSYSINTFCIIKSKDIHPISGKTYYLIRNGKYVKTDAETIINKNKRIYYEFTPTGLGLGSQTSQLLALLALNEIDHFIKEKLHIKYYGRYMDDLFLIHNDQKYLQSCLKQIEAKLTRIGLRLNPKKTCISPIIPQKDKQPLDRRHPFKFIKWNFYITESGKVIMMPYNSKIKKQKRKLRKMSEKWKNHEIPTIEVVQSYLGWRNHISRSNTFYIIQDMDNLFKHLFKGVKLDVRDYQ